MIFIRLIVPSDLPASDRSLLRAPVFGDLPPLCSGVCRDVDIAFECRDRVAGRRRRVLRDVGDRIGRKRRQRDFRGRSHTEIDSVQVRLAIVAREPQLSTIERKVRGEDLSAACNPLEAIATVLGQEKPLRAGGGERFRVRRMHG